MLNKVWPSTMSSMKKYCGCPFCHFGFLWFNIILLTGKEQFYLSKLNGKTPSLMRQEKTNATIKLKPV